MMSGIEERKEELMALLAWRVQRYTGLDSSSVRAERAQAILDSTLFTLAMGEEAVPTPEDGVLAAGELPLRELFTLGQRRIAAKLRTARQLHRSVVRSLPPTENECFRDTLTDGMAAFFRLYEPEFSANEIHITCDYPLYLPVEGRQGVDFIEAYLERALQENRFCTYFPPAALAGAWRRLGLGNPDAIGNLFGPVFLSAVACIFLRESPMELSPSPAGLLRFQEGLPTMSRQRVETLAAKACDILAKGLAIQRSTLKRYLVEASRTAAAELYLAAERGTLLRTFGMA